MYCWREGGRMALGPSSDPAGPVSLALPAALAPLVPPALPATLAPLAPSLPPTSLVPLIAPRPPRTADTGATTSSTSWIDDELVGAAVFEPAAAAGTLSSARLPLSLPFPARARFAVPSTSLDARARFPPLGVRMTSSTIARFAFGRVTLGETLPVSAGDEGV